MTAFPDAIRGVEVDAARNEVTARVAAARIVDVARWLHDTPEAAFDHITDICSVDYPNDTERFEVIYQLLSIPTGGGSDSKLGSRKSHRRSRPSPASGRAPSSWNAKCTT